MTPLHGIACFYDVGFGARAVSRKMPIYFIYFPSFYTSSFYTYIFLVFLYIFSSYTWEICKVSSPLIHLEFTPALPQIQIMLITNHDPYMEMPSVPRIANLETLYRKSRNSQFTNPESLSRSQISFKIWKFLFNYC